VWFLFNKGHPADAERWQRDALEVQRRVLGAESADTLGTMTDLASSIYEQGRNQEAIELARKALDIRLRIFGPEEHRTLALMDNLAAMLGPSG
jgi:Tetratricopeptide repeat